MPPDAGGAGEARGGAQVAVGWNSCGGIGRKCAFYNGFAGYVPKKSAVCKLVHDLLCRDAEEMYFDVLRKQVSQFKETEEGRRTMCRAMERIKADGKRETMLATARRMLKDGILAIKDVARYSRLSLAQLKKLQASVAAAT